MNILYYETPVPHITINNFYNEDELRLIWQELDFLTYETKFQGPDVAGSAKIPNPNSNDDNKFITKKNHGIWLDEIYPRREISNIITLSRKLFSSDLTKYASSQHIIFNYLNHSKMDGSLLSYYQNADSYFPHLDECVLTAVTWLYKEPKKFDGGDFYFSDYDYKIPIQNNMVVIFPSFVKHSVDEVRMDPSCKPFSGDGRYVLSNFITPLRY